MTHSESETAIQTQTGCEEGEAAGRPAIKESSQCPFAWILDPNT